MENFKKLKKIEKKLDDRILSKKLLIEEAYCQRPICKRRLRFFITIKKDQKYNLILRSKFVGNFKTKESKFSDVINSIYIVCTDENFKPIKDSAYEWRCDSDVEGFQLEFNELTKFLNIHFEIKNSVNQYRISSKLKEIIPKKISTKTAVIIQIWRYIKNNKLFDKENNDLVISDDILKKIFNRDSFNIKELYSLVMPHLLPLEPLVLEIPVKNNYSNVFDIELDLDDFFESQKLYDNKIINQLDNKMKEIQESIEKIKERIEILDLYVKDPHGLISNWVLYKSKDHVPTDAQFVGDYKFFYDKKVQKAVVEMLKHYK